MFFATIVKVSSPLFSCIAGYYTPISCGNVLPGQSDESLLTSDLLQNAIGIHAPPPANTLRTKCVRLSS